MRLDSRSLLRLLFPATLLVLAAYGCPESPIRFRFPTTPGAQVPSVRSPEEALRFLEWSWEQRDLDRYAEIVAGDFRFIFSLLDPNGSEYQDNPWGREDEMASIGHLFHGGNENQPPATSVTMHLDRNLIVVDDPRFGESRWHRMVRSGLTFVLIDANQGQTIVTGDAVFSLVRGDAAVIPEALAARGVQPDSTRWYLERWADLTVGGAQAAPVKTATMGSVRALYR